MSKLPNGYSWQGTRNPTKGTVEVSSDYYKYRLSYEPHEEAKGMEGYAPDAPPWIRVVTKRKRTKGDPIPWPWHYIDYGMPHAESSRAPIVCGMSIDVIHNKDKSIEVSASDPPDSDVACSACLNQMRQSYHPSLFGVTTYWLATWEEKPYLLMRFMDAIVYAIPVEHVSPIRLERADPRAIVSEALADDVEILYGDDAKEPDFTRYKFYGTRING